MPLTEETSRALITWKRNAHQLHYDTLLLGPLVRLLVKIVFGFIVVNEALIDCFYLVRVF